MNLLEVDEIIRVSMLTVIVATPMAVGFFLAYIAYTRHIKDLKQHIKDLWETIRTLLPRDSNKP